LKIDERAWVLRVVGEWLALLEASPALPEVEPESLGLEPRKPGEENVRFVAHFPAGQLLSTARAAKLLKLSPATISGWVRTGELKPAKRGPGKRGKMFFRRGDIEARKK
jgi:hypothetical protein